MYHICRMLNLTIVYGLVNIVQFGFSSLPTYDGVNPSMLLKLFPDYGELEIGPKSVFINHAGPPVNCFDKWWSYFMPIAPRKYFENLISLDEQI